MWTFVGFTTLSAHKVINSLFLPFFDTDVGADSLQLEVMRQIIRFGILTRRPSSVRQGDIFATSIQYGQVAYMRLDIF